MKKYLFYSLEGREQAPNGCDIENCQILGIVAARTPQIGLGILLRKNPWIEANGYKKEEIQWEITIDENDLEVITAIVNHLYEDERKRYDECPCENHIDTNLKTLVNSLKLSISGD